MRESNAKSRISKHKKPFYKKWWFWLIIVLFAIGGIGNIVDPVKDEKQSSTQEEQVKKIKKNKQSSSKKKTATTKTNKAKKDSHKEPYKSQTKKKVKTSNPKSSNNQKNTESQKQDAEQHKQDMLKSYAKSFGLKDAETVQKMVGSAYASKYIDSQGMTYAWSTQYGTLMRVDDTNKKITTVYLYDPNAENGVGQVLYQGQTILQKAPKQYYFYN